MQPSLFSDFPDADKSKPLVLLLGNVDHEGITSSLKSAGDQYKKKVLASSLDNWRTILRYFEEFTIRAVILKLNAPVYELLARSEYKEVVEQLFSRVARARHAAFVFEDLLSGQPVSKERRGASVKNKVGRDEDDEEDLEFYERLFGLHQPAAQLLTVVNEVLRSHQLNLIPYTTNAEITVIATQFLSDALEGLLFRVYVPVGRLWANEVDRLLQLFRDYLLRTGHKGVRLDQVRTDHGISYEFHGGDSPTTLSLSDEFQDFSSFLDLCVSNPSEAESLLRNKRVDAGEIADILTRYSKEAKRLQVDLRHDRERKLLNIRQRLESELADAMPSDADWQVIRRLVEGAIPEPFSVAAAYSIDQGPLRVLLPMDGSQLTVNLNPQIVQTVNGVVAREIRGDVNISENDLELLELIRQHGGDQTIELVSAVQELSDAAIPKSNRMSRAQKLKGFILSLGSRLGPVATSVFTAYIEKKLGLK